MLGEVSGTGSEKAIFQPLNCRLAIGGRENVNKSGLAVSRLIKIVGGLAARVVN